MLLQFEEHGKRRSRFPIMRPRAYGRNVLGSIWWDRAIANTIKIHELCIYPYSWDPGSRAGQDSTGFALIDGILSFGLSHQLRQAGRRSRD